jgi:hypothetical protein
VECKSGTTYANDWMDMARRWRQAAGPEAAEPALVYGGELSFERSDHRVVGWRSLGMGEAVTGGEREDGPPA